MPYIIRLDNGKYYRTNAKDQVDVQNATVFMKRPSQSKRGRFEHSTVIEVKIVVTNDPTAVKEKSAHDKWWKDFFEMEGLNLQKE